MNAATIALTWSNNDYSRMDHLGDMLLAARTAKGWTQRDVAERLSSPDGGHPEGAVVHKYEKGKAPGLDRMAELIAALDLDEEKAWRAYLDVKINPSVREALAARPLAWSPGG